MNLQPIEDILATQERINREKAALLNSGNPAAFVQPYVPPDSDSPPNIIAISGAQRGPAPVRGQNESWESFQRRTADWAYQQPSYASNELEANLEIDRLDRYKQLESLGVEVYAQRDSIFRNYYYPTSVSYPVLPATYTYLADFDRRNPGVIASRYGADWKTIFKSVPTTIPTGVVVQKKTVE